MAWVQKHYSLVVKLIDNGRNVTTKTYEMTAADDITATADALVIIGYLEGVSACGTVSYSVNKQFYNDALVVPAGAAVQCEAKALLVMVDETDPTKKHIDRIPCPESHVFVTASGDGANIVDVADAPTLAYANMFSTAGEAYISDGERIEDDGLLSGRRVTHSSRRG